MKKKTLILTILISFLPFIISCGNTGSESSSEGRSDADAPILGKLIDARDNQEYKTVVINDNTWIAENLNASTFRNGDAILQVQGLDGIDGEWYKSNEPAWCYYDNDPNNEKIYGKLYNHAAVVDSRGLAPEGWHVATVEDWRECFQDLNNAGFIMKDPSDWASKQGYTNKGDNSSGFRALPGGRRHHLDGYVEIYGRGWWWADKEGGLYCFYLKSEFNDLKQTGLKDGRTGLSVRCVKDAEN